METEVVALTFPATSTVETLTTQDTDDAGLPLSTYVLAVSVASVMFLITVIPNAMIIMLVVVDRKLRKLSNYYIISLATADCIMGAIVMPCLAFYSILGFWALGGVICDLWIAIDFMCATASMLSLCMISLDRYWAITQPLKHMGRNSSKRALLFVTAIWTVSLICWVPAIVAFRIFSADFREYDCLYLADPLYVLLSTIFIYYAPMFAMVFLYAKVYFTVRRQSKSLQMFEDTGEDKTKTMKDSKVSGYRSNSDMSTLSPNASVNTTSGQLPMYTNRGFIGVTVSMHESVQDETVLSNNTDPDNICRAGSRDGYDTEPCTTLDNSTATLTTAGETLNSISLTVAEDQVTVVSAEQMRKVRLRRTKLKHAAINRRTAKTLGIIVTLFLLCWLPFVILFPINAFCSCVPGKMYDATYWLAYLNSTLNPFLYGFSRDFRRAFKRLFCQRCMSLKPRDFSSVDDLK